jgi:hypothetical protein
MHNAHCTVHGAHTTFDYTVSTCCVIKSSVSDPHWFFNVDSDSDPAFYLRADPDQYPDPNPGSHTNAGPCCLYPDPDFGQTLLSQNA